ncbi:hypothetical protein C5167_049832 [Papaver somniferum]|uniref:ATP-dependent RNA helicase n=1 Tax=Papaver somniferum TaxID=3469 RepID=A0A4Y7KQF9_PAPSO|nr:probable DEAD-box ATP-dependent RNA helicase 48 isoform X1 [Papaver somniferum]RZC74361.1 hypothetical protein C5167_049832 [Papaver somniferum]
MNQFLTQKRSATTKSKLLFNFSFNRYMGSGGPKTFPGGLNKWQWKRMHEKKAKEKEKTGALADRFMKEGAEDLWNENDGPLKSSQNGNPLESSQNDGPPPPSQGKPQSRMDLRNLVGKHNLGTKVEIDHQLLGQRRFYSVGRVFRKNYKFRRNESSSSDDDDEDEECGSSSSYSKNMMSGATLGAHDKKKIRLVPKWSGEDDEIDLSQRVRLIRDELRMRKSVPVEEERRLNDEGSILSDKRFEELGISPLTIKALTLAGYSKMTKVQEAILSVSLDGKDALVKAKTGSGKTAAFLLPAIETVLKSSASGRNKRIPPLVVLILCPTRELASQTTAEANVLLKYHDGIGVQTLTGGRRFEDDQKLLESDPCQIIVATPGRLLDHIENKSGFSVRLMGLKMLIIDEADRLLDLGFRKDIEKLVDCIPRQRQTLFFSAAIPKEVRRVSQLVLDREHVFVDTVGQGALEVHDKIKQSCLVAPHELHFQIVYQLLKDHVSQVADYKVVVFCTTAMVSSLLFQLLRGMKLNAMEMHSRKPQAVRDRVSEEFQEAKRSILVTSDASARVTNYPDVTLVIQVGVPPDREQYIHRRGRMGREGKGGEGILILAPWEEYFLDEIKDLTIEKCPPPQLNSDIKARVENAMGKIDSSVKEAAYHAWLGYYNSIRDIGRDKTTLVELADRFCGSICLQKPPSIFRKTAFNMGLKDIPGIKIRK